MGPKGWAGNSLSTWHHMESWGTKAWFKVVFLVVQAFLRFWYPSGSGIRDDSNPIPAAAALQQPLQRRERQKHSASFVPCTVLSLSWSCGLSPSSRTTEFEVQILSEFHDKHPQ